MFSEKKFEPLTLEEQQMTDKIGKKFDFDLYFKEDKKILIDGLRSKIRNEVFSKVFSTLSEDDQMIYAVASTLNKTEIDFLKKHRDQIVLHNYYSAVMTVNKWFL